MGEGCYWNGSCVCEKAPGSGVYPSEKWPCPVPAHRWDMRTFVVVDPDNIPVDKKNWTEADAIFNLIRTYRAKKST
jgi:hypothetical protein